MAVTAVEARTEPSEAAFRDLFDRHAPYVWRCLRRLGVPAADVPDLCQEVFVVVHRKQERLEGEGSVRAWLYGIAVRKVWDWRRLAHRRHERATDEVPEPSVDASQAEVIERRAACETLDALLEKLEPKQRDVFVLYEIEQLPMNEIAPIVGCPLQTAYSRLHAARAQLQAAANRMRAARSVS